MSKTSQIPNIDQNYAEEFRKSALAKKQVFMGNIRAENQYIWIYAKNAFVTGACVGAVPGLLTAIYYRKNRLFFKYAIGFGLAYGAFHGIAAYFRNEI